MEKYNYNNRKCTNNKLETMLFFRMISKLFFEEHALRNRQDIFIKSRTLQ